MPRLFLSLVILVLPALIIIMSTVQDSAPGLCELKLPWLEIQTSGCLHLRIAYGVLGAAAAFGLIALMFWERIGLLSFFDVPWFGVGEDVENAGLLESVVRAAVFIVFLWLVIGMAWIAWIAIEKSMLLKTTAS